MGQEQPCLRRCQTQLFPAIAGRLQTRRSALGAVTCTRGQASLQQPHDGTEQAAPPHSLSPMAQLMESEQDAAALKGLCSTDRMEQSSWTQIPLCRETPIHRGVNSATSSLLLLYVLVGTLIRRDQLPSIYKLSCHCVASRTFCQAPHCHGHVSGRVPPSRVAPGTILSTKAVHGRAIMGIMHRAASPHSPPHGLSAGLVGLHLMRRIFTRSLRKWGLICNTQAAPPS